MTGDRERTDGLEARLREVLGRPAGDGEPRPGFEHRVIAGAAARVARARRRLAAGLALGLAGAAVAGFVVADRARAVRGHDERAAADPSPAPAPGPREIDDGALVADLAALADVDSALSRRARWDLVLEPLAPYARLAEQEVTP